jgi:hypothetical protein
MAKKKSSKVRVAEVPSLRPHLARSLKAAKALRGKVAVAEDLEDLIAHLQNVQTTASSGCSPSTGWARKFALASKPAKKTSTKSAKKR